ncbi:hypothetical protein NG800_007940 [Epilithonimonas ginsengisoli]|uniref:CYTH domain-containing protein n=1 Tax=Epilithonimonas ginsengisoli TaxID=1245592 RepID=A0ABU4JGT5_9FLAO|nr:MULTISPECIES: hypothetical protein [Chryseobacterium group]MBV6880136.1 hypothetical protein [Epilithonimonas sp. FP105]MDW8548837.1 hypothetical protein [Epilithonimonas ginsengisoli]OAH76214.1 hypothetical protein AXA65_01640 [Chryseobacterium sp. FP211-J200]
MEVNDLKSYLKLEIIWRDEHMFELKVTASNKRFSGTTEVYDTSESLYNFAQKLIGFPKDDKQLMYELGKQNGYAFCSLKFYCIDGFGKIGVHIILEDNVNTEFRNEEKSKVKFEIIVEPAAIDNFQKNLLDLSNKQKGIALLYGNDNRLIN